MDGRARTFTRADSATQIPLPSLQFQKPRRKPASWALKYLGSEAYPFKIAHPEAGVEVATTTQGTIMRRRIYNHFYGMYRNACSAASGCVDAMKNKLLWPLRSFRGGGASGSDTCEWDSLEIIKPNTMNVYDARRKFAIELLFRLRVASDLVELMYTPEAEGDREFDAKGPQRDAVIRALDTGRRFREQVDDPKACEINFSNMMFLLRETNSLSSLKRLEEFLGDALAHMAMPATMITPDDAMYDGQEDTHRAARHRAWTESAIDNYRTVHRTIYMALFAARPSGAQVHNKVMTQGGSRNHANVIADAEKEYDRLQRDIEEHALAELQIEKAEEKSGGGRSTSAKGARASVRRRKKPPPSRA